MSSAGSIFISYRRSDSAYATERIHERLVATFGQERLFLDVDSIPKGIDFIQSLDEALSQCQVLLVVMGPDWLRAPADDGTRRLDHPDDPVRLEIESALERDIPFIPVLLDGMDIPEEAALPQSLHRLRRRQGVRVGTGGRFSADMDQLIQALTG